MSNDHTRTRQKRIWVLASFAVVVAIGWWGVRLARQQGAIGAAAEPGGMAPDFTLPSTAGGTSTLSAFREKKNVLLFFHKLGAVLVVAGIAYAVLIPQARPVLLGFAPYALLALCPVSMLIGRRGGRAGDDRQECARGRGPQSAGEEGTPAR